MRSYFDKIPPDEAEVLMAKQKWYIEAIVDCAVQLNGTYRLNVNGDDDVGKNVASIVRFIDETWRTRNHRALGA